MYHESTVVPHPENTVRAYLSGGEIPVIAISDGEHSTNQLKIQLPSTVGSQAQVDWLRSLAGQLEDLAEQVEQRAGLTPNRGLTLAGRHIAEAKVAAGVALATTDSEYDR